MDQVNISAGSMHLLEAVRAGYNLSVTIPHDIRTVGIEGVEGVEGVGSCELKVGVRTNRDHPIDPSAFTYGDALRLIAEGLARPHGKGSNYVASDLGKSDDLAINVVPEDQLDPLVTTATGSYIHVYVYRRGDGAEITFAIATKNRENFSAACFRANELMTFARFVSEPGKFDPDQILEIDDHIFSRVPGSLDRLRVQHVGLRIVIDLQLSQLESRQIGDLLRDATSSQEEYDVKLSIKSGSGLIL